MIAYFLDHLTLQIKDAIELSSYTLDIDEEVNNKSTLVIHRKPNATAEDYVVLKNKSVIEYQGKIENISNENGHNLHTLSLSHISNIFNRKVLLANEGIISATGIEDFIKLNIENEFSNSTDAFINLLYIEVAVLTHTPIVKSVEAENGIYNFHTYITNAKQNYDINITYVFDSGKLKVCIYKEQYDTQIVDATISDVIEYNEVREVNYTAKVTVKAKDTGLVKSWYLQTNRTVTDDSMSPSRVIGNIEVVTAENEAEMQQAALDVFKNNSYKHLIEFKLKKDSKVIVVDKLIVGTPIKLKTKSGGVFDSYISGKIIDSKTNAVYFKCGNLRVTLTDKLKKGVV